MYICVDVYLISQIDVFSFGMTIYELLGLQKPFDNLCKINPSIDINKYVTKQKRPSLSVKVHKTFSSHDAVYYVVSIIRDCGLHILCNKL